MLDRKSETPDPVWTEPDYLRGEARDALGIETASTTILEGLLPGINTVTNRARYYSFFAWVLHEFIRADLPSHTQRDFFEWLRPREDLLILAHLSHGHQSGAVGTDRGSEVWGDGEQDAYPLDWRSLASSSGGAYQANYSGALEEMAIIDRDGDPHHALQEPVGLRLAEAYGKAVRNTEYMNRYWRADRVPRSVVEDFAGAGCLCGASRLPEEREALVDAFFRFDAPSKGARRRLASLGFFLDVIDQSRGMPLDLRSIRALLYFWSYGTDHPYVPEGNLVDPAQRWRYFQLRQYYAFSIECLWTLFLATIQGRYLTPDDYLEWLLSEMELTELGERYGVSWPTQDLRELTVRDFRDAVEEAVGVERFAPGPAALGGALNEHALYISLEGQPPNTDATLWCGTGMLMLGLLGRRCLDWRGDAGWSTDADGEDDRLPIEAYLGHVGRAMEEGWTMSRWLSWLHERYLWLQHRRVALEKMMARGRNPALFVWEEGSFFGLAADRPKMNNPRIENAFRILGDLKLIRREDTPDGPTYALTRDGERPLRRFQAYDPG
jgi:hypothetical protein